ncbi:cell division protein FtsQ/DivIB [Thermodesulforhabdus norvegica]|uniref:Cell division septal protein FtsQ n=1 Tax=Thermodesulforhabdus norvegica TaxID=39841 RepID=A0A1I4SAM1_9BACT|nr:FtsQ-type POTRA domain-containing protein [Thermodesulforhabdus norvegica]SFM61567.1 Cell division septal protein FtsQ [Thermodesulforhabdus norvegica]
MNQNKGFLFLVITCLALCSVASFLGIRIYNALSTASPWRIQRIDIKGNKHLSRSEIYDALGIPQGASIWWYSLPDLAQRLENHPWIREAFVRWDFPQVLSVEVLERQPFVTLCCNECYYIDNFGAVFDKCNECYLSSRVVKVEQCNDVVIGQGKIGYLRSEFLQRLSSLLRAVAENRFPAGSYALNYSAERGFLIDTENIQIVLGFEDFDRRIKIAKRIMQRNLINSERDIKLELDIRYRRKAYVRPCLTDGKEKHGTR